MCLHDALNDVDILILVTLYFINIVVILNFSDLFINDFIYTHILAVRILCDVNYY